MAPGRCPPLLRHAATVAAAAIAAAAAAATITAAQTVRYNVGGGSLPDLSPPWAALPGGALRGASARRSVPPTAVAWTKDDPLYASWRVATGDSAARGGRWGLRLPVPAPGTYTVSLHWAEMGDADVAPGRRVFHVAVGADDATPRVRLWAVDVGARARAAVVRSVGGVAASRTVTVELVAKTGAPFLSGVRLTRTGGPSGGSPPAPSVAVPQQAASAASVNPSWAKLPAAPPQARRHENGFVAARGRLYLLGGRGKRPVNAYDPASRSWSWGPRPPIEMHHFQAVASPGGGAITVGMAWTGGYPRESNIHMLWTYTPATKKWKKGAAIPRHRARGAGGAVLYKGVYYFVNGNRGGHGAHATTLPWFDSYDPAKGTWKELPDAPVARDHVHATVVGNKLVVVGGRDGGVKEFWSATRKEVCVYSFATGKWRILKAQLAAGRGGAGVATLRDRYVVVSGGEVEGGVVPTTEVLDMRTEKWLPAGSVGRPVTPRHGTQATTCGRGVYMAAGAGTRGGGRELSSAEVLTLKGDTPGTC